MTDVAIANLGPILRGSIIVIPEETLGMGHDPDDVEAWAAGCNTFLGQLMKTAGHKQFIVLTTGTDHPPIVMLGRDEFKDVVREIITELQLAPSST